jgi:hypothetical protein
VIQDEKSFIQTAKTFYDNSECNSLEEFEKDIEKIGLMKTHFSRFDLKGTTNLQLLINHFISFVNCFGIVSEQLMKFKICPEHHLKINSMFVMIGLLKFNGTTEIDEVFFIELQKTIKR